MLLDTVGEQIKEGDQRLSSLEEELTRLESRFPNLPDADVFHIAKEYLIIFLKQFGRHARIVYLRDRGGRQHLTKSKPAA